MWCRWRPLVNAETLSQLNASENFLRSHKISGGLYQRQEHLIYIRLEARLRSNIGNTLRCVWTVFTRSAITPPKVNWFGWIWSTVLSEVGPGRLWPQTAQKRERESEANFCFFCQVNSARLYRFPVDQISRNLRTRRGSVRWWILSEQNFANFPVMGRFSKKAKSWHFFPTLATSGRHNSRWAQIDENSQPNDPSTGCQVFILTVGINSKSFPWPVQSPHAVFRTVFVSFPFDLHLNDCWV